MFLITMFQKVMLTLESRLNNQKGAVSFEWIMLGMLAVAVIGVVALALEDGDGSTLADAILETLASLVEDIGG